MHYILYASMHAQSNLHGIQKTVNCSRIAPVVWKSRKIKAGEGSGMILEQISRYFVWKDRQHLVGPIFTDLALQYTLPAHAMIPDIIFPTANETVC